MKKIIVLLISVLFLFSCNKFKKLETGLEYKIVTQGSGKKANYGDVLKLNISQTYNGKVLMKNQEPWYQPLDTNDVPKEFFHILSKVRVGDSIITKMLTDSVFTAGINTMPKEFEKGQYIITSIKVLDILPLDKK